MGSEEGLAVWKPAGVQSKAFRVSIGFKDNVLKVPLNVSVAT